jgi:5-methylcytosine-specific restriction endonuclease McrA
MKTQVKRTLGSIQKCDDCGGDYVYKSGPMTRCIPCQKIEHIRGIRSCDKDNPQRKRDWKNASQARTKFDGNHAKALVRDGCTCQICFAQNSRVVHHIDGNGLKAENTNHALDNLVTLCASCHVNLHAHINRGLWAAHKDEVLALHDSFAVEDKREAV